MAAFARKILRIAPFPMLYRKKSAYQIVSNFTALVVKPDFAKCEPRRSSRKTLGRLGGVCECKKNTTSLNLNFG